MHRKRYENSLFMSVFIVMIFYVFALLLFSYDNITGEAAGSSASRREAAGVYGFLSIAKNYPEQYIIVVGSYATDYEVKYAEEISAYFGIYLRYEEDVSTNENLILFGKPSTNSLLDKMLAKTHKGDEALITLEGNNLIILANDEEQAKAVSRLLQSFNDEQERLSPMSVTLGFSWIGVYGIFLFFGAIAVLLFLVERHRNSVISRAQELSKEHKMESIENYMKKYIAEGYPEEQIEKWLVNYGYDESLVKKAAEEVKNAGAAISS